MKPAEFLLIDIGNTDTKLRLAGQRRLLGRTRRLPTARLLELAAASDLLHTLADWRYRSIVLASVVPAAADAVAHLLPEKIFAVSSRANTGVDLRSYPGSRTLGADRLADMAGARALHPPQPMIVADLGTAAVFNAIDAAGVFRGGVIAPGMAALLGSLPGRTSQLPVVDLPAKRSAAAAATLARVLGRNTREALLAGAAYGYAGGVREIVDRLRAEMGGEACAVIVTGGDAKMVRGVLPADTHFEPDLTMHGLRVIGALNVPVQPTSRRKPASLKQH